MGKIDLDACRWGGLTRFGVEDFCEGRAFADELAKLDTGFDAATLYGMRHDVGLTDAFLAGMFDRLLERVRRKPSPLRRFWQAAASPPSGDRGD